MVSDLYAFWDGWWQGQTHFYPDKDASVSFGGTVRLVGNGVIDVNRILPKHNFAIKVCCPNQYTNMHALRKHARITTIDIPSM